MAFLLPVVALAVFGVVVGAVLASAGATFGYDFQAYIGAARRLLDGAPLYDPTIDVAGGFAIYLYPPPFALAVVPFALVGGGTAVGMWTAALILAFAVGVALMPVGRTTRWVVVLLAGLDWPVAYSLKLGQVGPILFLLFAVGWRWLDRPGRLGTAVGLGTIVKLQPGLLLAWAAFTGRWRAVAVAIVVVLAGALVTTIVAGAQPWLDYPTLLGRVSSPLSTPHNFTPGAIALGAGAPQAVAAGVQVVVTLLALGSMVVAARFASPTGGYLVAVVASQLVSPLLWDHYAILLLLPVAWLLDRRQWWASVIPLATAVPLVGTMPPVVYPIAFVACLLAPIGYDAFHRPHRAPAADSAMSLDSAR